MIVGFEQYTQDVTNDEIGIINIISLALNRRIGKGNAITNENMRIAIYNHSGDSISDPKMRKYIQYIRAYNLVSMLCGGSKGYWVAKDKEEWIKYREGFRSRVNSMRFTLACMDIDGINNNVLNK